MKKFLVGAVMGCLILSVIPAQAATQNVFTVGFSFAPAVVVASGNDVITLNSVGTFPHTFSTDAAICASSTGGTTPCSTGAVQGGTSASVQLKATPGTYDFYCEFHRSLGMVGKLIIR